MSASSLSSPQTLNLYTYCGNDPINHTDPSGLFFGFLKKLFKWILIAVAVVIAVLTIVAAPATIVGVLGAISAGANAASQVLTGLGYKKAGMIFGIVAAITGFGSIIGNAIKTGSFPSIFTFGETRGNENIASIGRWTGALGGVGAIANGFNSLEKRRRKTYKTAQQAAIAFLKIFNPKSIRINKEIAAVICKLKNGRYIYGKPQVLSPTGGDRTNDCPATSQLAGGVHAHARHDGDLVSVYGDGNEVFSPTDIATSKSTGTPEWIGTPSGEIRRYNPWDGSIATVSRLPGVGRTKRK